MATPPKSPSRKVSPKKVESSAAPVIKKAAAIAPAAKKTAVVASVGKSPMEKPMPFVIEPESLSAFVDHSDSVLSSTGAVRAAVPPPVTPAEAAKPEIATSIPSQPVVVEKSLAATIETAADWQVPNALEGHHIMNEAIETGKKFAEDAKARLQTLAVEFNDKAKAAMEKSSKAVEELSDITKGNVEALVESSKIAAKGVEAMGQSAAEYGRASFEKTSATLKSFASVKSPMEFFQLQSQLFTSTFDIMAAESAKSSEAFLKLAGEIAQPLSSRVAVVQDKLKALAA